MLADHDAAGHEERPRPFSLNRRTVVLAGAAALVAGGWAALIYRRRGLGPVAGPAAELSLEERRQIDQLLSGHPSLLVTRVQQRELEQAIASMQLPPADEAALRAVIRGLQRPAPAQALASAAAPAVADRPVSQDRSDPQTSQLEPLPLAWLTLWDFRDEDGDVVLIETAGYRRVVPLSNAPITLAIPLGGDDRLTLTGQKDGFGGITVALGSGSAPPTRLVLSEGQSVHLPLQPD